MKKTALIMAGGRGERFWPKSRKNLPKQFLSLTDDGKTMIQLTVERILPLVEMEDIYIATNRDYKALVQEQLPGLPEENILCEPVGKNTAPCIGLGAVHIARKYDDAVMFVLPSDHLIKYNTIFTATLSDAAAVAEQVEHLVTLGITPDYPETGYGYIKFCPHKLLGRAFEVDRFVEKPDLETAKAYLATEQYLWNSGMFIWKVSSVLKNMEQFLPETYAGLKVIQAAIGTEEEDSVLEREFHAFKSESIDYGIMEKAKSIYILSGSFGWDDVGSWLAVERIRQSNEFGNVIAGNAVTVDTKNCIIQGADLAGQANVALSWKQPQRTIELNMIAAVNLMEAVRAYDPKVRMVLVGSSDQYGNLGEAGRLVSEDLQTKPQTPYAVSKMAQEEMARVYVRAYGMNICMTRSFNHAGAGQREGFLIPDFALGIVRAERGETACLRVGNLTSRRDFTHVKDVVRAYREIAEKGCPGEVYNVGSGQTYSAQEILDRLREMANCSIPVEQDPDKMRPSDTPVICCDNTKLTKDTGWEPELGLDVMLRETLEEWRNA